MCKSKFKRKPISQRFGAGSEVFPKRNRMATLVWEECDHVTCECGHQFCWDCGIDRRIPLAHDNRLLDDIVIA